MELAVEEKGYRKAQWHGEAVVGSGSLPPLASTPVRCDALLVEGREHSTGVVVLAATVTNEAYEVHVGFVLQMIKMSLSTFREGNRTVDGFIVMYFVVESLLLTLIISCMGCVSRLIGG